MLAFIILILAAACAASYILGLIDGRAAQRRRSELGMRLLHNHSRIIEGRRLHRP